MIFYKIYSACTNMSPRTNTNTELFQVFKKILNLKTNKTMRINLKELVHEMFSHFPTSNVKSYIKRLFPLRLREREGCICHRKPVQVRSEHSVNKSYKSHTTQESLKRLIVIRPLVCNKSFSPMVF